MKLLRLLIVAMISVFGHVPLLAAEATQVDGTENAAEIQQTDGGSVEQAADSESDADSDETSEEESPSRFIPTEQISQDLGVSFPADI